MTREVLAPRAQTDDETTRLVAPALPWLTTRDVMAVVAPPLVALALVLVFWETWVHVRHVKPYLLPAPSAVALALLKDPERYLDAGRVSLGHALGGLTVGTGAAFLLAVVMAHSRTLERAIYPLAILVKVTPVVAVAPLLIIWFGFGPMPKVLVAALITFFPMLVNAVTGLRSVDPAAHDFFQALDATRWQVLWKLRVPASLPYVLAALRISIPLSLVGAVVAEWMSGDGGMGQRILIDNGDFNTAGLFGAVTVLAVIGVVLTGLVSYIEYRVLFWHESAGL
ncbi:MAG: ABC transporter permease [Dehalococcoidia bacterium]|nr:ABC transporter permease [Dehalococcoidia bacterium]